MKRFTARATEQLLWTLITFCGTSIGAAFLSAREFGHLALGSAVVLLVQALARAIWTDLQAIAYVETPESHSATTATLLKQAGSVAGAFFGAVGLVVLWIPEPSLRPLVIGTCLAAALVPASDLVRGSLLVRGRARAGAALASAAFAVAAAVTAVTFAFTKSAGAFLCGWAGAMGVVVAVGFWSVRSKLTRQGAEPDKARIAALRRRTMRPLLGEAALTAGVSQGAVFILAATLGPLANAAVRGGFLLFFPLNMAVQSLSHSIVPQAGRASARTAGFAVIGRWLFWAGLGPVMYLAIMLLIDRSLLAILLGDSVDLARQVAPGVALYVAGTAMTVISVGLARATGKFAYGTVLRAVVAPVSLFAPAVLGVLFGVPGIAVAYGASGVVLVAGSVLIVAKIRRAAEAS